MTRSDDYYPGNPCPRCRSDVKKDQNGDYVCQGDVKKCGWWCEADEVGTGPVAAPEPPKEPS